MSMLWALRRWMDPAFAAEDDERKRQRDVEEAPAPGGPGKPPLWRAQEPELPVRCRICARRAVNTRYCSTCLAETMLPER